MSEVTVRQRVIDAAGHGLLTYKIKKHPKYKWQARWGGQSLSQSERDYLRILIREGVIYLEPKDGSSGVFRLRRNHGAQ